MTMTNEKIDKLTECPSAENLCAWFDGQLESATIDAHVDSCPQCKSIIKSYKRIDRQIKENVERPTQRDMGILVRIKDGSMKEISRSSPASWLTPMITVKILLSCVIIAGLLATIYFLPRRGGGTRKKERKGIVVPPIVQSLSKDDKMLLDLAVANASQFESVNVMALGTNPEILDPIIEKMPEKELRPDLICMWETADPTNPLRFFKTLLASKFHKAFDDKILESSDYCTVILTLSDDAQREDLKKLLKMIGCTQISDSSVTEMPKTKQKVRFSFILEK